MRWLPALALTLLGSPLAWAARKAPEELFAEYHAEAVVSTPIKLTDVTYKTLTSTPRDYSLAVLLTAMDVRYGCQLCREFQPEWDILSRSWVKGDRRGASRMLFTTLDFSTGRDTFLSLGLQTAPVLLFFPPTVGPHAAASPEPLRYDFSSAPQTAEFIHTWLSRHMPDRPHPPVKRPVNYGRWIATTTIVLGSITFSFFALPYALPVIQNRNLWAAVSIIAILLFTSGHMFNHIRKVPYVAASPRGGVTYFAPGFQSQYGLETQVIAALYGVLSFCVISLAIKVPRIAEPTTQRVALFAWVAVMFVLYSFFLSVFRVKNGGYPFALPPFI